MWLYLIFRTFKLNSSKDSLTFQGVELNHSTKFSIDLTYFNMRDDHLFIDKQQVSIYYIPGAVLPTGVRAVN